MDLKKYIREHFRLLEKYENWRLKNQQLKSKIIHRKGAPQSTQKAWSIYFWLCQN